MSNTEVWLIAEEGGLQLLSGIGDIFSGAIKSIPKFSGRNAKIEKTLSEVEGFLAHRLCEQITQMTD